MCHQFKMIPWLIVGGGGGGILWIYSRLISHSYVGCVGNRATPGIYLGWNVSSTLPESMIIGGCNCCPG